MDVEAIVNDEEARWYLWETSEEIEEAEIGSRAALQIRGVSPKKNRELQRKASRGKSWTGRRKGREKAPDGMAYHKALMNYCVTGWRNFKRGGTPFDFSSENLEWMDDNSAPFSEFWQDIAIETTREAQASEDEELGN